MTVVGAEWIPWFCLLNVIDKVLHETYELFYVGLEDAVFAVDDVKGTHGLFVVQREHENRGAWQLQVLGGAGG
ncbi:MAG: hypothetical protein ACLU6Y_03745 [Ruminococcus sp.]